jgi:hypothetical protein
MLNVLAGNGTEREFFVLLASCVGMLPRDKQ